MQSGKRSSTTSHAPAAIPQAEGQDQPASRRRGRPPKTAETLRQSRDASIPHVSNDQENQNALDVGDQAIPTAPAPKRNKTGKGWEMKETADKNIFSEVVQFEARTRLSHTRANQNGAQSSSSSAATRESSQNLADSHGTVRRRTRNSVPIASTSPVAPTAPVTSPLDVNDAPAPPRAPHVAEPAPVDVVANAASHTVVVTAQNVVPLGSQLVPVASETAPHGVEAAPEVALVVREPVLELEPIDEQEEPAENHRRDVLPQARPNSSNSARSSFRRPQAPLPQEDKPQILLDQDRENGRDDVQQIVQQVNPPPQDHIEQNEQIKESDRRAVERLGKKKENFLGEIEFEPASCVEFKPPFEMEGTAYLKMRNILPVGIAFKIITNTTNSRIRVLPESGFIDPKESIFIQIKRNKFIGKQENISSDSLIVKWIDANGQTEQMTFDELEDSDNIIRCRKFRVVYG